MAGFEVTFVQLFRDVQPVRLPLFAVQAGSTCDTAYQPCSPSSTAWVTAQIPYDILFQPVPTCCLGSITVYRDGERQLDTQVGLAADQIHLIRSSDTAMPYSLFKVPGGSFGSQLSPPIFDASGGRAVTSPIRGGDTIVLYAYGLGPLDYKDPASATLKEGQVPTRPIASATPLRIRYQFSVNGAPGISGLLLDTAASTGYTWAGLVPGSVGLYQINLRIPEPPPSLPPCQARINELESVTTNLTITIAGTASWDGVSLCVQP